MTAHQFENTETAPKYRTKQTFQVLEGDLIQYNMYFFHNWNQYKFKMPYSKFTRELLHNMYSKYVEDGHIKKKYPLKDTNESFLNFVSTHYSAFSFIVNFLNIQILEGFYSGKKIASRQLDFDDDGTQNNWIKELNNTMSLIEKFKNKLFKSGEKVFDQIYKKIEETTNDGFRSEQRMKDYIKEINNNIYNIRSASVKDDTLKGIDILFDYNKKTFSMQHKKVATIELVDNFYFVDKITNYKTYKTDYIGFETKKGELYIFKNILVEEIGTDQCKIRSEFLVKTKTK